MSEATLSRDLALRIGLAARQLDDVEAPLLINVLGDILGLPPTEAQLSRLTSRQLKDAPGGELATQAPAALKAACAVLCGERIEAFQVPQAEPYTEGDMPDSVRVACASNSGESINGHFGSCRYFLIYQVSAAAVRLVDVRVADAGSAVDDKNTYRAKLVDDAQLLLVASIGGPAAAKVVRAGVHPIKYPQGGEARQALAALQSKLVDAPPPWLAKAMGHAAEARVRFYREIQET